MVHDSFEESGKVFEAGAGWYGTIQYYKSKGKVISHASADDIAKNWSTITNMNGAEYIGTITEQSARLVSILEEHEASSGSSSASSGASSGGAFPSNIRSSALFQEMADGVKADPTAVKTLKSIVLYIITDGKNELGKFS